MPRKHVYRELSRIPFSLSLLFLLILMNCSAAFSQTLAALSKQKSKTSSAETLKPLSAKTLKLSMSEYEDRVHAVWAAQMVGAIMGFQFEHKTASREWITDFSTPITSAMVDDDWYYEMAAIRAFEKYGPDMSVQQLGKQWIENSCGSWGSSEQARLLMAKGVDPGVAGHPQYNKLWFSIGPQFSADVYGALAPGMPNVAADLARKYCHINGYAEGVDGGVFVAAMISLGFSESDPKEIVRKAAKVIDPKSPYRKCIDLVISLADQGKSAQEVFDEVEDRWHIEYPATNNAVPNGGIVAASVWFGEGDFLKTANLAFGAADYTDADCNAANAVAVIGAIHGMKAIPENLVKELGNRIKGEKMGGVTLTPAVDESITDLAKRTVAVGAAILKKHGAVLSNNTLSISAQEPVAQPAELFNLADFTKYWNKDWELQRAGFGGAGGGMGGIRGITFLDKDVLATYPRDEVRGLLLQRTLKINGQKELSFDAGVDKKRAWELNVYINNKRVINKIIEGGDTDREWQTITTDLSEYQGKTANIRLYQRVLVPGKEAGNAYWKNITIK